jgi:hypothetical protein
MALIEADDGRWTRMMPVPGAGEAALGGIPPGDYKVYTFDRVDRIEWRNPDALSAYASAAVPLTLMPNEKHSLKVDMINRGGAQ